MPIFPCRFSSGEATSPPPNQTRMTPPATSTVGSQTTFASHGWSPPKTTAELPPVDAVGGARQAQAAVLGGVAAGVEHPIETVRIPYGRLAQTVLVERAGVAQFQDRVGAELLPADAVRGTRDAEALAASAVLAEIEEVEIRLDADHVRDRPRRTRPSFRTGPVRARVSALCARSEYPRREPGRCGASPSGRPDTNTRIGSHGRARSRWRRCKSLPRFADRGRGSHLASASECRRQRRRGPCARCGRRSRSRRFRRAGGLGREITDGLRTSCDSQPSPRVSTGSACASKANVMLGSPPDTGGSAKSA